MRTFIAIILVAAVALFGGFNLVSAGSGGCALGVNANISDLSEHVVSRVVFNGCEMVAEIAFAIVPASEFLGSNIPDATDQTAVDLLVVDDQDYVDGRCLKGYAIIPHSGNGPTYTFAIELRAVCSEVNAKARFDGSSLILEVEGVIYSFKL